MFSIKKIMVFSIYALVPLLLCNVSFSKASENVEDRESRGTLAFTTGYIFKHDDSFFKQVYGHGIENIITTDGCYYLWDSWGLGAKVSYCRAKGRTTFLNRRTCLYEVPLTFYVRKATRCFEHMQAYISLGGGVIFIKEKSYLGCVQQRKGIGELEIGANFPVWNCLEITAAFRYLFPREFIHFRKTDVGGFDLRAGIGFSF